VVDLEPRHAEPGADDAQSDTELHPQRAEAQRGLTSLIMRTFFYTRRAFDDAMRRHGLSGSQAGVLNRIFEQPGISGVEISRQMLTTPQSVQPILTVLERKGLIERRPDPTRGRLIEAHLTELGREVVLRCRADEPQLEQRLAESLTDAQRQALIDLLERYLDGAGPLTTDDRI
jgi:DNA-binding MarR family transcriptional regulator